MRSKSEALENDAVFLPEHAFFNDIPPRLGKGILRIQRAKQSVVDMSTSKTLKPIMNRETLSKLEMKIFARTRKTVSDLKFENSDWYQNWVSFRKAYDKIMHKIINADEDHLCQDERDWLAKYNEFKKKYMAIMDSRHEPKLKDLKDCQLYELFNSEEYMPPIPMFTATDGNNISINRSDSDYTMGAYVRTFGTQI